ncbi:MAG: hybrid sensor histidine kinase/response regulator [Verrucomicrobiota bacterium]
MNKQELQEPPVFSTSFPKISARILVVDDQPANIQIVGATLGGFGHEIVPATDGESALKRLSFKIPDLILLDLLMPDMSGFDLCKKIKENPDWAEIPIIFLSAADEKTFVVRALEMGGVDYIAKPFNHAELICRVNTHLELKFTRDRLFRIAQDKDEIYGIMAHDCKSLLGGIHMTSELLLEKLKNQPDQSLVRYIENIENSSSQMLRFVRQFLANAAWENNPQVNVEQIDLKRLIKKLSSLYQVKAEYKKITVHFEATENECSVFSDPLALEQIFGNLISNALKFTHPGKNIFIRIKDNGTDFTCEIEDEGPGFQQEDFKQMFKRYARLSARSTGGEPSTGLGLSIVKKLTEALNIKLHCETQVGTGSKFILQFKKSTTPTE